MKVIYFSSAVQLPEKFSVLEAELKTMLIFCDGDLFGDFHVSIAWGVSLTKIFTFCEAEGSNLLESQS